MVRAVIMLVLTVGGLVAGAVAGPDAGTATAVPAAVDQLASPDVHLGGIGWPRDWL